MQSKKWGRFELVELLGTGGMGDVYKAYDPDLKRHIALKILRHEDPEVVKRFLREACAQAQVEHTHVCKIYESGEHENHHYIAMQYIDGNTLDDLRDELTLEEKIRIMKDVALGLQAAHRRGLIHRDVKPSNIMVNQTDEGELKPFVMDFGIAREQEAPGLTSTGMIIGTPFYMSPEHAKGKLKSLDRRSDIYSLGVTLYEMLSGSVPFKGDTPVDVLMKVIEKDPQPLRKINPRVPVDIETIVMKCLEKDPGRRYGSAKELAEDLQRYLDGDPIKARPATFTYRIKRKLVKHKWPAMISTVATLLIIVLIGLWLQTKWAASKRAVIAQQLNQEVKKIETIISNAHLLPLHNISREKNKIRERIKKIEEKMKEVGKMGLGPGHYALGRGFVALQEYGKAKTHLEKAWEGGFQNPEAAHELGLVLGELYLKESEKAERIESKGLQEARKKEIEKMYREPAVRFLRQGEQSRDESKDKEYVEALIAFFEKNFLGALEILQKAIEKAQDDMSWLYKAKILEGNIFLAIGRDKSNFNEALENFSKAEEAYRQVVKIGESDIRGYIGLIHVLERKIMIRLHSRGGDLHPLVDKAITQCENALRIDPGMAEVYVMQSAVYRLLGRYLTYTGKDPHTIFDRSVTAAKNAIELQPENFEAYTMMGITRRLKGEYRMSHGQDPGPEFRTATASFNKAIEINPNYVMAFNGMGNLYVRIAQYEINQGKDPKESLNHAVSNFGKALEISPQLVNLYNGLAGALWFQGGAMMARGRDPRPSFLKAAENMENAIKLNPAAFHFHSNLGFILMDIGRYELDYGYSPAKTVNKAVKSFEKAIKINPRGNELYLGLVSLTGILIKYDYMMGKDCSKRVTRAAGYFRRGLEVNPNDPLIYTRMAANYIIQARYLSERDRLFSNILTQAEELLRKAKRINPKYHEIYVEDGELSLLRALWLLKTGQNPQSYFGKAAASLDQAAALNPKDIRSYLTRARLDWKKAQWNISRESPALKTINQGLASLEKALSINPNYAETYALKGVLLGLRSKITTGENSRRVFEKNARASFSEAFQINRNLKPLFSPFLPE